MSETTGQSASLRVQLRVMSAAFWTAITATLIAFDVDIPSRDVVLTAWGGFYIAATGVAEGFYDYRMRKGGQG